MKFTMIAALLVAGVSAAHAADGCRPWTQAAGEWTCLTGAEGAGTQQDSAVVRNEAEWRKFWTERGVTQAPAVDFSKQVVVTFAGGDKRAFKVVKVAAAGDKAVLESAGAEQAPKAGLITAESRVSGALKGFAAADKRDGTFAPDATQLASFAGFDARGGALRDAVANPLLLKAACTPGVNCKTPAPKPQNCDPGVDCPEDLNPPQRRCTPGVNCGGSTVPPVQRCTPGVNCGNGSTGGPNGGTTAPTPDNYRPRPSSPPSSFPDPNGGSWDRFDTGVDSTGWWHEYRTLWGATVDDHGRWQNEVAKGKIERAGSEKGQQGTRFSVTLVSNETRTVYRLHWRWVGRNCDPNDSSRCMSWDVQYAWFYEGRQTGGNPSAMNIDVEIVNDQRLLPWETETIYVTYDGSSVGLEDGTGAFDYAIVDRDRQGRNTRIQIQPGDRRKHAPESDKVRVRLEKRGGSLMMVIDDLRNNVYSGEPLEIVYQLRRKDCGRFFCGRKIVQQNNQQTPLRIPVQDGQQEYTQVLPTQGSDTYYADWYFRRAQSKFSTGDWSGWKQTPETQY